jgi:hypothetical protein
MVLEKLALWARVFKYKVLFKAPDTLSKRARINCPGTRLRFDIIRPSLEIWRVWLFCQGRRRAAS